MSNIQDIRKQLARGDFLTALKQTRSLLKGKPKSDEAILLTGRFQAIRRQVRTETMTEEVAIPIKDQIREDLLDLLRELEEQVEESESLKDAQPDARKTIIQKADKIYNIDKIDNAHFS